MGAGKDFVASNGDVARSELDTIFSLQGDSFGYPDLPILDDFHFSMEPNSLVVLLGPSGCGKTTLLQRLSRNHRVAMMFQEPRLIPWFTVEQNLRFVLHNLDAQEQNAEISRILEAVGLASKRRAYPDQLSGGQRQRVNMARAFVYPGEGLLLDEPFQGLDVVLRYELIGLLTSLWKQSPKPIVAVSHDPREAALLGTDIRVFSGPPMTEVGRLPGNPAGPGVQNHHTLELEEHILGLLMGSS